MKEVVLPVGKSILCKMERIEAKSKIQLLEGSQAAQDSCYLIVESIGPTVEDDIKEGDTLLVNPGLAMTFVKVDDNNVVVPVDAVLAVRRTIK